MAKECRADKWGLKVVIGAVNERACAEESFDQSSISLCRCMQQFLCAFGRILLRLGLTHSTTPVYSANGEE